MREVRPMPERGRAAPVSRDLASSGPFWEGSHRLGSQVVGGSFGGEFLLLTHRQPDESWIST